MPSKLVTHVTASVTTFGGGIPEALISRMHEESLGYNIQAIGHKIRKEITGWPISGLSDAGRSPG